MKNDVHTLIKKLLYCKKSVSHYLSLHQIIMLLPVRDLALMLMAAN